MRYMALAVDYDETIAEHGRVSREVVEALERVKATGRRLVLVTGRQMPDLLQVFPETGLFDRVCAENGATLYLPDSREELKLAASPPAPFIAALRAAAVEPLAVGKVIVATRKPHENTVIQTIWKMGLELQIIFNGDAVMVLPPGVNKASGLATAVQQLGLSQHEVVAVGNAENDHSLLQFAECGIAVANAVDTLKASAAYVTFGKAGEGVIEVANALVVSDLENLDLHLPAREIVLGANDDGSLESFSPYGANILIAGPSGAGKSTFATGLIERFRQSAYQMCILDPEGDYGTFEKVVTLGSQSRAPGVDEVIRSLSNPQVDVAVSMLGVPLADRPDYFMHMFPSLLAMRAKTSRPHWLLFDEVHHYLPAVWGLSRLTLPQKLGETIMLTVHPDEVSPSILEQVDMVIAVGPHPNDILGRFAAVVGERAPLWKGPSPERGEIVVWSRRNSKPLLKLRVLPSRTERLRHLRKYAEGDLGGKSFYFRGPRDRLNLRAHNLVMFCHIGEGVDDETWMHHLRSGEYANWFRYAIKDEKLAAIAEDLAETPAIDARESFHQLRVAIEERYILPPA